jgi:hypothetical protein
MTSQWRGEDCEYCRFRVDEQCCESPPSGKRIAWFNTYPTVGYFNEFDGPEPKGYRYSQACAKYQDARR